MRWRLHRRCEGSTTRNCVVPVPLLVEYIEFLLEAVDKEISDSHQVTTPFNDLTPGLIECLDLRMIFLATHSFLVEGMRDSS